MHSGDSSTRGDEFPKDDQQDRRHGRPRHPREPGPTARTATASTSPADTDDEGPLRPGGGRRRPRAAGRRDGLRLVWRADHRASPGPDPQMVFGDLPAPRRGANPRCGLGPGGSADRRTARASLRAAVSHPPASGLRPSPIWVRSSMTAGSTTVTLPACHLPSTPSWPPTTAGTTSASAPRGIVPSGTLETDLADTSTGDSGRLQDHRTSGTAAWTRGTTVSSRFPPVLLR